MHKVQFKIERLLPKVVTRLKMLHNLNHEFLVFRILPSHEIGPEFSNADFITAVLEKREEVSKFEKEFREEELVDFDLDIFGELFQHFSVLLVVDAQGKVTVVCPSVFEVFLKLFFEHGVDGSAAVEFTDHGEEAIEGIGVIVLIMVRVYEFYNHFSEYTQHVSKYSITGQQNKGAEPSLKIILGMKISETNGGKRSESIVHAGNNSMRLALDALILNAPDLFF